MKTTIYYFSIILIFVYFAGCSNKNIGSFSSSKSSYEIDTILNNQDTIFSVVEEMPEFPGGTKKLFKLLAKHVDYPKEAKENNKQGRVFVSFIVEEDGSISNIGVVKGVCKSLDQEAIRVVKKMPQWEPGKVGGRAVKVRFNLPIKFTLS